MLGKTLGSIGAFYVRGVEGLLIISYRIVP